MSLAIALITSLLGAQVQAQGAAGVQPLSAAVEVPANAAPELKQWADELRAALHARKQEFVAPKAGAKPDFAVRLDALAQAQGDRRTVKGTFVRGEIKRNFTYTDVRLDAEKLARNSRKIADEMAATGK